jgi:hypothetical protein
MAGRSIRVACTRDDEEPVVVLTMRPLRISGMLAVLALVLSACTTDPTTDASDSDDAEEASIEGPLPDGPSALDDMDHPDFPEPLVDTEDVISGGPPPDGIPPIDEPAFVTVDEADAWLDPEEPVVALEVGDEVRAYPVQILMWHEIVNDTVDGMPVAVTYCPLCNTAVSFDRRIGDTETTFGTSGRLYASALVMYDRATESLWTHFDGRAVIGTLAGHQLDVIPSPLLGWAEFVEVHPDALVLDRDRTGHNRDYGANPYTGYDDTSSFPFLFRGFDLDERATAMQRIVGVERGDEIKAWTLDAISDERAAVTTDTVDGDDVVILWRAGQTSALERAQIAAGRDVGSVGVFLPEVDGQTLDFRVEGDDFVDEETGSTWTVVGTAVEGPLEGEQLERLHHFDTFWFAWSTYRPETVLVEERP